MRCVQRIADPCMQLKGDSMPFDKIDIDSIDEERRKSVAKSIRAASHEELEKLGDEVFHDLDDPWRDEFFKFIEEHRDAIIYHAIASDGVHMLYCPDKDKGIWFLPGSGKGTLSATGRQMMKEAVGARS
jgi:hypothetical protein